MAMAAIKKFAVLANRKRLSRNAQRDFLISQGALGGGPTFESFTPTFPGGPGTNFGVNVAVPLPGGGSIEGTIPGTEGFDFDIELGNTSLPGLPQPQPTTPLAAPMPDAGCFPGFSRDPITHECRFDLDPGPGTGLPGGNGAAGGGLTRPRATARTVLECPRFADGKKGILWMNALTGDVVCLPRRTNGRGFGLIRKNAPRKPAYISAAQKASLRKMKTVQNKAKKFATDAGFSCKKR